LEFASGLWAEAKGCSGGGGRGSGLALGFKIEMDILDIKAEIHRLRFDEGKTLQEIAKIFGKSIYWVNARLNKNYEPKRVRQTSDDIASLEDVNIGDEALSNEVFQVRKLREQGLSYEQIASSLNRSIYWVHTRLQGKYMPKGARAEKQFQEKRVIPYMTQMGFTGILQYVRTSKGGITQEADIIATLNGKQYITEVKVHITHHELQTAIGQLIIHRYTYNEKAELQIALPKETDMSKLSHEFVKHLESIEKLYFLFVP
jgi:transcriptional regulator with XRE-family HTH domain